jgi:two-component system sensor histidine kinase KdpD
LNTKDEFLGLVSHELRTPVTTILGNAQVLRRRWNTLGDEARTTALTDMHDDANRLRTIIENLLLVARLENDQPLEIEPMILRHTIQALMEDRRRRHPDRAFELVLPEDLVVVDGNQNCIEQVMSNLLNNAEKYSPRKSPITVRLERRADRMIISVEDRGIGVDGNAEDLFTPFYRARRASDVSGIGLGLTVCQRLVEAQGGRIWARSRPGGGSIFAFDLPVTKLDIDEDTIEPLKESAIAPRFAGGS